jgi:hypothetical protein
MILPSTGDLPLIITISDTCKNQPKTLDFDNTINLSSLIVSLVREESIPKTQTKKIPYAPNKDRKTHKLGRKPEHIRTHIQKTEHKTEKVSNIRDVHHG